MSKATIKDIAKALGYSISTVSRALRDSYEISEETKQRVLAYANEVNYKPDPIALSLKEKKTHSICVIVPEIANNFFSEVIDGIDYAAYNRGYSVFFFQTHEHFGREVSALKHGLDRRVDGFILSLSGSTDHYDHLKELKRDKIPTVFFDRVPPMEDVNKVVVDNFHGSYEGVKSLVLKGKKHIALISSPLILSVTKERVQGYKACLKDHGIDVDERLIKYCGFQPEESYQAIKELLTYKNVDGIFINSDRLALNSLDALKRQQPILEQIPEIVGFSNMKHVNLLDPPMTSIHQPAWEIGIKSANLLIDQIESKLKEIKPSQILLKTSIKEHGQ